jgi:hypothetical protein
MLFFDIKFCSSKACLNWRPSNKCIKDSMHIPTAVNFIANIHDASTCEVRKQIDIYKLTNILEK